MLISPRNMCFPLLSLNALSLIIAAVAKQATYLSVSSTFVSLMQYLRTMKNISETRANLCVRRFQIDVYSYYIVSSDISE